MKKSILFLLFLPFFSLAQPGYIHTIAGTGSRGMSGDGGPATAAQLGGVLMVFVDAANNVYCLDESDHRIRKVNTSGIINTFAGGGSSTADGIPATNASLYLRWGGQMVEDPSGNIYFCDGHRVRKIDAGTGIITTVAGSVSAGFSGDGGPATAATLRSPVGLCFDATGNLFVGDEDNFRIRKINTSGIITTIAGSTYGFSGDGGPASTAQLSSPSGMCFDAIGNLYVADVFNFRIRKIDVSGTISTYAGVGSGFSGDGGHATLARFYEPSSVCMDTYGNLYIGDFHNGRIRKIDPTGIVSTFAGGGSSTASGIPATAARFGDTWGVAVDGSNNVYVADRNNRVCKVNGVGGTATAVADSFSVFVNTLCHGPSISIRAVRYVSSLRMVTYFGDGSSQTDTFSAYTRYAMFNHNYPDGGVYTVRHLLYNGSVVLDSVHYNYTHVLCNAFPIRYYYEGNGNCIKDSLENHLSQPILTAIDSNGVTIDTISSTAGFDYYAYGAAGDVYRFRVISMPGGYYTSCPTTGTITDTISTGVSLPTTTLIGFTCSSSTTYDFSLHAVTPRTTRDRQSGDIYVDNAYCLPADGTVTLRYSSKYAGTPTRIYPTPTSVSGNTIVWNARALSAVSSSPLHFSYSLESGSTLLTVGDTVHSYFRITPTIADADTTNNNVVIVDTVRASYDPNAIEVDRSCIESGILPEKLTYTIHFENMGNDTAQNIHVLDTLPSQVDPASLRIIMSSHQMFVSRTTDGAGRSILKFDFPNIKLLDSSYHGLCDGTFMYHINTRAGLTPGTRIVNRAGIYFDINEVVMTNEIYTRVTCPVIDAGIGTIGSWNQVSVSPNPANDVLEINTAGLPLVAYTIYNTVGRAMKSGDLHPSSASRIDISHMPSGFYIIELKGGGNQVVKKFVKM